MRIIPFIILFSALALGIRVLSLSSDFMPSLLPAVSAAEDTPAKKDEKKDDHKDGDHTDDQAGGNGLSGLPSNSELDFSSFATCTDEDIRLVEQLRQRRLVLDKRQEEIEIRENLLLATEVRIQDSTQQLVELEQQIKAHLKLFDEREQRQLNRVVEVYSKMKAKDAAPRFEQLDLEIQVDLATIMQPKAVADIIANMSERSAVNLTSRLATIASAPSIDDVQGNSR